MDIAPAVRTARAAAGWTVRELAERAHVGVGTVVAVEKGERSIHMRTAQKLANAFGIALGDLFDLAANIAAKTDEINRLESEIRTQAIKLLHFKYPDEECSHVTKRRQHPTTRAPKKAIRHKARAK